VLKKEAAPGFLVVCFGGTCRVVLIRVLSVVCKMLRRPIDPRRSVKMISWSLLTVADCNSDCSACSRHLQLKVSSERLWAYDYTHAVSRRRGEKS